MKQTLNSYRFVCNLSSHGIVINTKDVHTALLIIIEIFPKTFSQWKIKCSIPEIVNFNRNIKR